MGHNDHLPSKATRTPSRRRGEPKALMHWDAAFSDAMGQLVEAMSKAGGYVGFGRNREGTCLLLYVKLDDWVERVAIETTEDVLPTLAEVLAEL